jgi:hypothetical protein
MVSIIGRCFKNKKNNQISLILSKKKIPKRLLKDLDKKIPKKIKFKIEDIKW